jgi:hypoxanthine phosphoribosyltransferase
MVKLSLKRIVSAINKYKLPDFDLVLGIAEGGMIPAVLIAGKLGCKIKLVHINFRDDQNFIKFSQPRILSKLLLPKNIKNVLIVDDVSRSGKTLKSAKTVLKNYKSKTMVFVGKADYVLFPAIKSCVKWPWQPKA